MVVSILPLVTTARHEVNCCLFIFCKFIMMSNLHGKISVNRNTHAYLLPDVLVGHIARPSLSDESGPLGLQAAAVWLVLVLGQPGQEEPVRQEALPRQHDAAVTQSILTHQ